MIFIDFHNSFTSQVILVLTENYYMNYNDLKSNQLTDGGDTRTFVLVTTNHN